VHVPVDELNRVPGTVTLEVTSAKSTSATLELSYDDGQTWVPLELHGFGAGRFRAIASPPAGAAVSLRVAAADRDGNRFAQTIIRAFTVA
jgi:hypothetical protein